MNATTKQIAPNQNSTRLSWVNPAGRSGGWISTVTPWSIIPWVIMPLSSQAHEQVVPLPIPKRALKMPQKACPEVALDTTRGPKRKNDAAIWRKLSKSQKQVVDQYLQDLSKVEKQSGEKKWSVWLAKECQQEVAKQGGMRLTAPTRQKAQRKHGQLIQPPP